MSLRENAYDFLNESLRSTVQAESEPRAWKFAILHVVQAIELVLKARLHAEHPVLVFSNVDSPTKTVSLGTAIARLESACLIKLTDRERRPLNRASGWRDRIVHHDFEMPAYQVEAVYVQLFELLNRFHDEHTDFGPLHQEIVEELWPREAELFEFFREEFVTYNGVEMVRTWPAEIVAAQTDRTVVLHGREFERLPYGSEPGWEISAHRPCGDCGVRRGQLHVATCDVQACPRCFGQLLTCGCLWDEGPAEDSIEPLDVQIEHFRRLWAQDSNDQRPPGP